MVKKIIRKSLTDAQLVKQIKDADKAYHDNDKPIMSDATYDALKDDLASRHPNHPLLSKVGEKPTRNKKVSLYNSMSSLPKVRIGEPSLDKWLLTHKGEKEATDKLDGISAGYGNHATKGYYLHTRGDGATGSDISHLIPYVKGLGTIPKGGEVRGEIVVTKSDFKGALAKQFANARNLAAGIANKKGIHPAAKKATFIVHEQVVPSKMFSKVAPSLKAAGFIPVKVKVFKTLNAKQIEIYLKERLKDAIVDIDGVVLNANGTRVAVKNVNEVALGTIDHIEWNVSRFGLLKPVAIFKVAVKLAGAMVKRATAHNAAFVQDNGLGPGAVVSLIRSGEVIPYIADVVTKAKPQFPPRGTYEWDGDVDIRTTNVDDEDQKSLVMSNFLSVLGVKQFKSNMMAKLVDDGIDTVEKLLKCNAQRFVTAGFGETQAETLYTTLQTALTKVGHPRLSAACGIFPAGFGVRRMTAIFNATGTRLFKPGLTTLQIKRMVSDITGVGPTIATDFTKYFPKYLAFLNRIKVKPLTSSKKGSLTGKTFAFTGFRDKSSENMIESKGGQVTGVTRTTTYLVTPDPKGSSEKLKKARALGITIISPMQLKTIIGK